MSDISSAGITRGIPGCGKACRKDVLRRVDVPVVPGAAGWARPVPGRKAQLREQGPAHQADAAKGARQHLLLRVVWVCSAPVRRPPPYSVEQITVRMEEARRGYHRDSAARFAG